MAHTFISYSSKDRPFVSKLAGDLKANGVEVWLDVESIQGRKPYWEEIQQGVEGAKYFIFVASPDAIEAESGAMDELYHAKSLRPAPHFVIVVAREVEYDKMPIIISPGRYQYHDFAKNTYEEMLPRVLNALGIAETPKINEPHLRHTLKGHQNLVATTCFSPHGKHILSASHDGTIRIWDANDGVLLDVLRGHDRQVNSAEYNPQGTQIVSAGFDGTACVWDVKTRRKIYELNSHRTEVYSAVFHPAGDQIATSGGDGKIVLWEGGQEVDAIKTPMPITDCVAYSPDGLTLASAGGDGIAYLWQAGNDTKLFSSDGHKERLYGVEFSPNGKLLVTTSYDKTAIVWDVATSRLRWVFADHRLGVRRAHFSRNGQWVATASFDGTAKIWEVATGELLYTLNKKGKVCDANFSPNGKFVTVAYENDVQIWQLPE